MEENLKKQQEYILSKILEDNSSKEVNLGVLDELTISKIPSPNLKNGLYYERATIRTGPRSSIDLSLYKIHREYPLVLDHVKKLFRIYKTKYYHCQLDNLKYLARLCINEISLDDYIKMFSPLEISNKNKITNIGLRPSFINEVQRIISFNWIMCITTTNTESKIYVRCLNPSVKITQDNFRDIIVYPFTCNEKDYSKDITCCDISDKILNKWFFGSREVFYEHIKKLMKDINIEDFKIQFEKIIQYINPLLLPWVNVVYNRMESIQYLNIEEDEEED